MSEEIESRKVRKAPLEGAAVSALKLTSRGKPISKRSEPVDLWGDLFGLSRTMAVNSETWDLVPDPLTFVGTNGAQLYQLNTNRFNLLTDGTRTVYTLSWNGRSLGWTTRWNDNQPPDIFVEVEDSHGGVVDHWDVGRQHFLCAGGPTAYSQPNALNVYGIAVTIVVTFGSAVWFKVC